MRMLLAAPDSHAKRVIKLRRQPALLAQHAAAFKPPVEQLPVAQAAQQKGRAFKAGEQHAAGGGMRVVTDAIKSCWRQRVHMHHP